MEQLLTKKDLAQRWKMSEGAIDDYRQRGLIQAVKGLTSVRFSPQHIAEIEGIKLERFSPLERRKLEDEIEVLKRENEKLKEIITKITIAGAEVFTLNDKKD